MDRARVYDAECHFRPVWAAWCESILCARMGWRVDARERKRSVAAHDALNSVSLPTTTGRRGSAFLDVWAHKDAIALVLKAGTHGR